MTDEKTLLLDYMKLDRALTPAERRAIFNQRGKRSPHSKARPTALPGPDGETCGTCKNLDFNQLYKRRFYKCGLVNWTHGAATDIRKRDPSCERWEVKPKS